MVQGRVQGVFFRKNTKKIADTLGLTGYAKNLSGGEVEIVAEGGATALQSLLDWCYRGSTLAKVSGLSFTWKAATETYNSFTIDREGKNIIEDKFSALEHLTKNLRDIPPADIPQHIVIIPDGNRRWAQEKKLPVWRGHERAFNQTITHLLKEVRSLGVTYLTMWGFSTENWKRNEKEIQHLMRIFKAGLKRFRKEAFAHEIRIHHFGRKDRLPKGLVEGIRKLEADTAHFTKHHFAIALDYGGRDELLRAFRKMKKAHKEFSEEEVMHALDTNGFPDPDLIIRTSGEKRLSGMMPWQAAYAELYFTPIYFPDFGRSELRYAVADYVDRKRRYGK